MPTCKSAIYIHLIYNIYLLVGMIQLLQFCHTSIFPIGVIWFFSMFYVITFCTSNVFCKIINSRVTCATARFSLSVSDSLRIESKLDSLIYQLYSPFYQLILK